MKSSDIQACLFDVFGTVVDWRTSVSRELAAFAAEKGFAGIDWVQFALDWRKLYQPSMEEVRSGRRPWTILDALHRESLLRLLERYRIEGLSAVEIDYMNRAWHRLDPWPDVIEGLTRLKRKLVIATCSNGNIALIVNMAKRAGLPWDCVLGAETVKAAKAQGLATAFVPRPREHGPGQTSDLCADRSCVDLAAESFVDLAVQLGC